MTPRLATKRLTLDPPTQADLATYQAFYTASDVKVGAYRGGRTDAKIRAILQHDIAHWAKGFGIWMLRLTDGQTIGGTGLAHADDWNTHELTWWLLPDHRGHGYAFEASRAVITFAYETLGWPQVETFMRDANIPARRLAERLGGTVTRRDIFPDGVARNVYALPRTAKASV